MIFKNFIFSFASFYQRRPKFVLFSTILILTLAIILHNWNSSRKIQEHWRLEKARSPRVTEAGARIEFPEDHPGLARLVYQKIGKGNAAFSVIASARVIASINTSVNSNEKLILFDSGETTHLYSEYKRTRAVASKAFKDLARVKDMYVNQAATRRDVTDAESNFAVAREGSSHSQKYEGKNSSGNVRESRLRRSAFFRACDSESRDRNRRRKELRFSKGGRTFVS
ncbi:hypothetical protein LEP1GSC193_3766 [Leptospira alstonii serovar Pingchang str. 80-412]|uniref:Uncharacterized protein n=2 Tax=Leptospira alstonii TaxID=28452 RepID=M6CUM2_9LEPT|nr:hypothetical protein [Leptospira alstonii]EMJ92608.1 hypothetical protein LEP1GSC194_2253 [Leptospira alstonii serovar Sichuan str. 79601]EQA80723.1 hypothetical protein LEP1GSC193_3766 [Leptospira alstonii serovar Pingchang str. 80-412]